MGGSDDPSNLFLLCKECHKRAPDFANREFFLLWARNQSWFENKKKDIKEMLEFLKILGVPISDKGDDKTVKIFQPQNEIEEEGLQKIIREKSSSHYGVGIVPATWAAIFYDFYKQYRS